MLVAQARYERGVSNYLDVTDAQRSSLAADRAAAQIRTQRLLAAVAVARSLGAGWTQQAPVATIAQAHGREVANAYAKAGTHTERPRWRRFAGYLPSQVLTASGVPKDYNAFIVIQTSKDP